MADENRPDFTFFIAASSVLGLIASIFHLGRPERAWRAASMRRTDCAESSFDKVLETKEHSYATSLLGKEVSYYMTTESGELATATGIVDLVTRGTDGEVQLSAGERTFSLDDVAGIREL